ncbi:murein DD-endopeptidase MepM/ murein hydrolase activator NlpD [Melghirimyces profundicolus]|uniref:Murein DD-endopeptidase MepM/ murein hydrolase activator NlpD n=1 Tax=Melghirimyces profundicolus TaxID=1242148 RepID=A0A2T6BS28_9BACL|nr:M23 family metallopeptidase [Melghirimyces profundicolus]PTX58872.1 murein DD-endopeptidase MepM/ murein hydrolase activator NlpD [Melghirimyces profundicolus]
MWKWMLRILLLAALGAAAFLVYDVSRAIEIPEMKVPGKLAPAYVEIAEKTGVPWPYLAALDEVEKGYEGVTPETIRQTATRIQKASGEERPGENGVKSALRKILSKPDADKALKLAESYSWAAAPLGEDYEFPFKKGAKVSYGDTWGASRTYGGDRTHEGTDLMADKGTPIRSVSDGRVVAKGWNELGGWRLTILDANHLQISYYYAHLSRYAEGIERGSKVKKGQVIGYVGDSGYGEKGTTGQFAPHLHLGMYVRESTFSPMREAINPYPFLKVWEKR